VASKRWHITALLIVISAYGALGIDLYLPALPALGRAFNASAGDVQWTLVVFYLGFAASQPIYGPLADRYGRKAPLYVGLALFAVSNAGAALAPSLDFLIVTRFFQALGACAGTVIARAIVRDLFQGKEAAQAYSLLMTAFMVVPMLAPIAGSFILVFFDWRVMFWTLSAFSLVAAVVTIFLLPETLPVSARSTTPASRILHEYASILKDRRFLGYAVSAGFTSGTLFSYIAGAPHVIIDVFGISPTMFSVIFAINAFGIMSMTFAFSRASRRYSVAKVLHYSYVLHAAAGFAFFLAGLSGYLPAILATLFLVIASYGSVTPGNVALAMEGQGHRAGMASALFGTMQFVFASAITSVLGLFTGPSAIPLAATIAASGVLGLLANRFIAEPLHKAAARS